MKKLAAIAVAAVLTTAPAFAEMNTDSCDVSMQGDVSWQKGVLTLTTVNDQEIVINPAHNLTLNGKQVSLNSDQQEYVTSYYEQIETAVPMTLNITYDALELAGGAINEAFGELLGADNGIVEDLDEMFADLRTEMNTHFYDEDGEMRISSEDFDEGGWVSERWEDKYEDKVEDIIANSTGRLLIAVGKAMLSGDDDFEEFEQHMENWEEDFEQRVEAKSSAIEARADELCEVLKKADYAENKMQKHIPGLESLDMLKIDSDKEMLM